ncbi:MAG TPA: hypothetical protein DCM08_00075 [Microscillaceae bacterium]|nr:hypothetical protein [Microscillaceae bacterium]
MNFKIIAFNISRKFYLSFPFMRLQTHEDAYGRNIYDTFVHQKGGYDIVEREDGHFSLNGDSDAYTEPFDQWESIQQKAVESVKGRVLDVGCGGGKHAFHLQNKGFDVVAMDNSPLALEVCKRRGIQQTWLGSVEDLNSEVGIFDTILMFGNNFGLLENFDKAHQFFHRAHQFTSDKALILAETLDPYGIAFDNEDDRVYQQENRARGRMTGQVRVRIRYRKYATPWADYLFVSLAEMEDILKGTGWKIQQCLKEPKYDQYIAFIIKD